MRTIEIKAYTITELSDKAQRTAHENYMNSSHFEYHWTDEAEMTLQRFAERFDLKVRNWEVDAYNYSYRFDLTFDYRRVEQIEELTGQRLATYIYNNYGSILFPGKYYGRTVSTEKDGSPIKIGKQHPAGIRHVKRRSRCIFKSDGCPLTGYCLDFDILKPIYDFLLKPTGHNIRELLDLCLESFFKAWSSDMESQTTLEYFIDHAQANEYEFTEEGERL